MDRQADTGQHRIVLRQGIRYPSPASTEDPRQPDLPLEHGRLRLPTAYHSGEGVCGGFQDLRIQFTPHPDRRRPLRPATRGSYQHGHHPLLHASKTERLPNQHRADRDRYHQPYRPGRDGRRRVFHRAFRREGMERNPATHRLRRSRLSDLS